MVMIVMLGRQHIPVYRRNTKELVMNVDLRFWGPGTTWLTAVLPSGGIQRAVDVGGHPRFLHSLLLRRQHHRLAV